MHIKKVFSKLNTICSLSEIVRSFVNATVFLHIKEPKKYVQYFQYIAYILHIKKVFSNFEVTICSLREIVRSFII